MKREIIFSLLFALMFSCQPIFAQQSPVKGKGQSQASDTTIERLRVPLNQMTVTGDKAVLVETGNTNILVNPGFETAIVSSGWTASAGTVAAATGENIGWGNKSVRWTPNAAGDTFMPGLVSIPNALKNGNAEASVWYSSAASGNSLLVLDENSNIIAGVSLPYSISYTKSPPLNFVAPGNLAGSLRPQIKAISNAPINLDEFRIGAATNIGSVAQATTIGVMTISACNASWDTTSGSYGDFTALASCTYTPEGQALAPTTVIPAMRFNSLPAGYYELDADGTFLGSSTGGYCQFRLSDGTNAGREENSWQSASGANGIFPSQKFSIKYDSPQQSAVTLRIQAKLSSGSGDCYINAPSGKPLVLKLKRYPLASEQVANINNGNYDWTSFSPTTQGWGSPTFQDCKHSRDNGDLLIMCTLTTGTRTSSEARLYLPNTSLIVDASAIKICGTATYGPGSSGAAYNVLCDTGGVNYVNFAYNGNGGLAKSLGNAIFSDSTQISFFARIPIVGWRTNQNAPVLIGSVTSNSSGPERIERLTSETTSCSITRQSGAWIPTAGSHSSTSVCSYTIASGTFSATPTCSATGTGGGNRVVDLSSVSTTGFTVRTILGNTNAESAVSFDIICMGPK